MPKSSPYTFFTSALVASEQAVNADDEALDDATPVTAELLDGADATEVFDVADPVVGALFGFELEQAVTASRVTQLATSAARAALVSPP